MRWIEFNIEASQLPRFEVRSILYTTMARKYITGIMTNLYWANKVPINNITGEVSERFLNGSCVI